jgi:hypothetical protein
MISSLLAVAILCPTSQEDPTATRRWEVHSPSVHSLGRVRWIGKGIDIRDVLLQNPDASKSISDLYDTPEQREERLIRERAPVLESLIETFVRPPLRPDVDRIQLKTDGMIRCSLDDERDAWLDAFLRLQRRTSCMLDLQFRFVQGARGAFDRFGLSENASVIVSQSDLAGILQDSTTVTAPRIVVWNRQQSSLSVLDKIAYVERWDVRTVEPNQQVIVDPVIREVPDGVTMGVSAVLLEDALFGAIVDVEQSRVARPIPTKKVRLATPDNREVEVAVPETTTVSLQATVMLRAGEIALFRAPLQDDAHDVAVLLSIRRVDPEPQERR